MTNKESSIVEQIRNVVAIAAGIISIYKWETPLFAFILFIIAAVAAAPYYVPIVRQTAKDLIIRWRGPDVAMRGVAGGFLFLVMNSIYRFRKRSRYLSWVWVSLYGLTLGVLLAVAHLYFKGTIEALGNINLLAILGLPFAVTWTSFYIFRTIKRAEKKKFDPHVKTVDEFVEYLNQDIRGKSIDTVRQDIIISDDGPIDIVAAGAITIDRLNKHYTDHVDGCLESIFEEAWRKNDTRHFHLFIGDPTSDAIIERAKTLNGRYIEYYALPYLKLLLKLRQEEKSRATPRITLKRLKHPEYRVVASGHRMLFQRYGIFTYGGQDHPVFLSQKGMPLLYQRFTRIFKDLVSNADTETFIMHWTEERLMKFARCCRVSEKYIDTFRSNPEELSRKICERLGLRDEFDSVTRDHDS